MSEPGSARRSGIVRCAIYTRKSSEEGLEQAFNSLDAQREACEAYIKSQKHEGWTLIPDFYDDGGISGGTMERPALKRLLADIEADRVDTVVVYKVDRLTRSLSDFSRIVSVFDAKGVSFVSITQQFNTTTSMGRLTLNMLLSFAQFEREVTGERIRDKVAASKKKGMWMGGVVPLGYEVKERKLVIIETEAETVRLIYRRYGELGSVRLLAAELEQQGVRGKPNTKGASGSEGSVLARGALYRILSNRLYLGEVHHQGTFYPGEHPAIIQPNVWDRAARLLADNRNDQKLGNTAEVPSLLAGLLKDAAGEPLTASHASKGNRRYRYYISRSLLTASRQDVPDGLRLPAADIEAVVETRMITLLTIPGELHQLIGVHVADAAQLEHLNRKAETLGRSWRTLATSRRRALLLNALVEVVAQRNCVDLKITPHGLIQVLLSWPKPAKSDVQGDNASQEATTITLSVPAALKRSGIGKRMIIAGATTSQPDPALIKLLIKAREMHDAMLARNGVTVASIAAARGINDSYATRLLRLSFLSPDLVKMILDGRQPATLTARRLCADTRLPIAWSDQLAALS